MQWYWIIAAALVIVSALMHRLGILRFDTSLHWSAWVVAALVLLNGGWMAFDGGRALVIGDYVTPRTGQLAGALGPWSKVVEAVGIDPRSTLMKSIFLTYGLAYMATTSAFLLGTSRAWWPTLFLALLGFWYIPFGTLINLIVLTLLLLPRLRSVGGTLEIVELKTSERNNMRQDSKPNGEMRSYVGVGLALGAGIGVAIGTAMGNIGVGIALGVGVGLAIGAALSASKNEEE